MRSLSPYLVFLRMKTLLFTCIALQALNYGYSFSVGALWLIVAAWLVVVALMGLLALHAYRRFVARPHPFLAE